jgi:hypothetical protein
MTINTSTIVIEGHNLAQDDVFPLMMLNTIGVSVLVEVLKSASKIFTSGNTNYYKARVHNESQRCFAFVRGTGLEFVINTYHLDYDAEKLKDAFYATFHYRPR